MRIIISFYRLLNILSLDVAVGSIVSAYFLARVFDTALSWYALVCLGLSVWLIYTADHLVDARLLKGAASTTRHKFHQTHFRSVLMVVLVVASLIVFTLFHIEHLLIVSGLKLSVLVIVYFLIQRTFGVLKELFGAVLYSIGVMLPVISLSERGIYLMFTLPAILYFNTVLINIILFSWFDREKDLSDNHPSLVTIVSEKATLNLLYILFLIQASLLVYGYVGGSPSISVFALMFIGLLVILIRADWFNYMDRYRLAGDAIFFIPLLQLIS